MGVLYLSVFGCPLSFLFLGVLYLSSFISLYLSNFMGARLVTNNA